MQTAHKKQITYKVTHDGSEYELLALKYGYMLRVDGVLADVVDGNNYVKFIFNGQEAKLFENRRGIYLKLASGIKIHFRKHKWYQILMIFLPWIHGIIGVLGGLIGGALGFGFATVASLVNQKIMVGKLPLVVKIILCLVITIASAIWLLIYFWIVGSLFF